MGIQLYTCATRLKFSRSENNAESTVNLFSKTSYTASSRNNSDQSKQPGYLRKMSHNKGTSVSQEEFEDLVRWSKSTEVVPILQHKAENRISRQLRDVALRGCSKEIESFAQCARGKTISVAWTCRSLNQAVDKCMKVHGNDEGLRDEMRRRFVFFLILFLALCRRKED